MEAASTAETSANLYQTTQHNIAKDSHLLYQIYIDANRKYSSVLILNLHCEDTVAYATLYFKIRSNYVILKNISGKNNAQSQHNNKKW
jgi:hypothetical protein